MLFNQSFVANLECSKSVSIKTRLQNRFLKRENDANKRLLLNCKNLFWDFWEELKENIIVI